jgi:hypothetical protein
LSAKLHISDSLALPIDVVTMRTAIYGTSGAGKTTFARLVAEKVHAAGQRFCAIDLKNDWWGLKSSADGKSEGIPVVVFGGPRRDVQIFDDAGAAVAETVAAIDQSCIVDLDSFSKRKQLKFIAAFFERLYEVNRDPLLLFNDESDRYASQKPMSEEGHAALSASEDICRRGRKRGIGSFWITQRTAVINKNVSGMCDLTVVFRTPGVRDLKELEDHIGRIAGKTQVAEVMRMAPGLDDGQAIFLSANPKLRGAMPKDARPLQMPLPETFDSSATPHIGQRKREPKVLAKTDLAQIEERMAQQVERAKAEDPKHLRKQVGELQATIRMQQQIIDKKVSTKNVETKVVEKPVLKDSQIEAVEKWSMRFVNTANKAADNLQSLFSKFDDRFTRLIVGIAEVREANSRPAARAPFPPNLPDRSPLLTGQSTPKKISRPEPAEIARPAITGASFSARPVERGGSGENNLTPRLRQILDALATCETIGLNATDKSQLALFSHASPTSSAYGNNLSTLRTAGFIEYPAAGFVSLTETGRAEANSQVGFSSRWELHKFVYNLVKPARATILEALIRIYPDSIGKAELAEKIGVSAASSSYGNNLSSLRTLRLIDYPQPGHVMATDLLFPPLP